jgi:hypothetical protein
VSSLPGKNTLLPFFGNIWSFPRILHCRRGVTRRHERWGRVRWTCWCRRTSDGQDGRPSRVVLISRRWDQARGRIHRRRRLSSPVLRGEHEAAVKTIAQGMFWGKIVNKINGKSGMCPPCVAIRGGHDFSTTCPWKAAHWRCGPPNVQSGESEITPGKTRQVDLRDNYVASEVVLCWAGANAGFVPPKRPRRKRA